jgi:hypothetical protein
MKKKVENSDVLLADMKKACGSGLEESEPDNEPEFMKSFMPIRRHLRILDSQVRLIVGDKGAGKSHLFKALRFPGTRKLLVNMATKKGYDVHPFDRTDWLVGFEASGQNFPASGVIDDFVRKSNPDSNSILAFWMTLLVDVLRRGDVLENKGITREIEGLLRSQDITKLLSIVQKDGNLAVLFAAIDQCDKKLSDEGRDVIITYDELDRLSPTDWDIMRRVLGGLIQFWAIYFKRWRHIGCKIFLRRDLYEHAQIQGPDLAKIAWSPVDLFWNTGEIYALLFKRLANSSQNLRKYLSPKLDFNRDSKLGWMLDETSEEDDFASAVELLVGKYMGPDRRKGLAVRWIPNHLKDGHGRVFPRPFLRLFAGAVQSEEHDRLAEEPHILHYTAVRGALDRVSEYRLEELAKEEFPWIKKLQAHLKADPFFVPCMRNVALKALKPDWAEMKSAAPATEPNTLLEYLTEIGIFTVRTSDARIDVGDLYLKGLGLKRKGGVARPNKIRVL